jgi:hypothetical protein
MRAGTILLLLVAVALALSPALSLAQQAGPAEPLYSYTVDIDDILEDYGLGENDRIVKVNADRTIRMENVLVIMGSKVDLMEREGFSLYTSNDPIDPRLVLEDGQRTFYGRSIEDFDLIVVGGPDHNIYARELLDRGIIRYGTTDLKMPGMVIEAAKAPSGHTILVVGSVAGYPYHRKDLPLNGIIPEKYAGVSAVAAGVGLGILGALLSKLSFLASWWDKLLKFVMGYLTSHASEVASEKESEARKIKIGKEKKAIFLGFSLKEMAAAFASAILFGVAFVIADRLALLPANVLIYILTGGLVLAAHDLGHRLIAYLLKVGSEFQFWGLGTVIMFLTSWLFGLAFAQPGRFMMDKENMKPRNLALVTLAGPAISMALTVAFLPLALFGGLIGQIGVLGFTMNLVTVVYNLMPFSPMDGKSIYDWSKLFWALLFVPILLFFVVMTYFVL